MPHRRLLVVVLLLLLVTRVSAAALSTFALAKADNATVVCSLLPSSGSPLLVDRGPQLHGGWRRPHAAGDVGAPVLRARRREGLPLRRGPLQRRREGDVDMLWWDGTSRPRAAETTVRSACTPARRTARWTPAGTASAACWRAGTSTAGGGGGWRCPPRPGSWM
jgi:hypothetical protein